VDPPNLLGVTLAAAIIPHVGAGCVHGIARFLRQRGVGRADRGEVATRVPRPAADSASSPLGKTREAS
jgi:hypothetical protein